MSGIEVVGILLGVLPIVLRSVDVYKESIRRVGTAIRKRKHVEKLARALLLQQQILEETVKSIILASGCKNVGALDEDPFGYFSNDDVRESVEEYLGPKNSFALVCLLTENNAVIKEVAKNISGLIPAHQDVTDDLVAVINANQEETNILVDLAPRVKLFLGINDMKDTIQEIDSGTAAIDRFSRLILSNLPDNPEPFLSKGGQARKGSSPYPNLCWELASRSLGRLSRRMPRPSRDEAVSRGSS